MPHQITINPSGHSFPCADGDTVLAAAMAADLMLPYGCRNGACGTCKGKIVDGQVDYGPHQPSTLTDEEKRQGLALFCCAKPLTDLVLEVKEVRRSGDIQIRKLPCRVESIDKPAPDVAIVKIKLPANERLQFLAGQYIDLLLKDGRRRSFSLATPPHDDALLELHVRYRPRRAFHPAAVQRVQGPRDPALRRAARHVLPARGIGQADHLRRRRHRLRADQGHHRARAAPRDRRDAADGALLGRAREARPLSARSARPVAAAEPQLHVHPGAVRSRARGRLARPHRPRAPGGAGRLRRSFGVSGLRVRRSGDGRRRAQELRRNARAARRTTSSPTASRTRCSRECGAEA